MAQCPSATRRSLPGPAIMCASRGAARSSSRGTCLPASRTGASGPAPARSHTASPVGHALATSASPCGSTSPMGGVPRLFDEPDEASKVRRLGDLISQTYLSGVVERDDDRRPALFGVPRSTVGPPVFTRGLAGTLRAERRVKNADSRRFILSRQRSSASCTRASSSGRRRRRSKPLTTVHSFPGRRDTLGRESRSAGER